jgi:DNA polymerase-3 subunit gamma/tau
MFYLKYRPQTFAQLDSKKIRETLGAAVLHNNWAHAYLLTGTRGSGKTTTARLIAKTVNCVKREKGEEACNKCASCLTITSGSSLDVIEIDAASNTGVDDIRNLREKVKLAPAAGRYRVYIIDEVHMLSTSAFNALLKTLEEPPPHVIFVLATTDPQKLPETIVSRCLVYDFGLASDSEVRDKLDYIVRKEKLSVGAELLDLVVARAAGSHRDAQKMLEQSTAAGAKMDLARLDVLNTQSLTTSAEKILRAIGAGNSTAALEEIAVFAARSGKFRELISEIISQLRDHLILLNDGRVFDDHLKISKERTIWLVNRFIAASGLMRDCPVPQLPLEMAVIESGGETANDKTMDNRYEIKDRKIEGRGEEAGNTGVNDDFWPEVLAAAKQCNHSLTAFLRASRPKRLADDLLTIEVFYEFHKEKLEEKKNREVLEKIVGDIIGREIRVNFELTGDESK